MLAEAGPTPSSASEEGKKGGSGDGVGIALVDNAAYTNYKHHDSDGGDGGSGSDKVITAGRSTWESAQTYLVRCQLGLESWK